MKTSTIVPLSTESPFEIEELFFSFTDKKGIIRAYNDVFTRVSEYLPAELLGAPHNLIRHPDMPRCVFKLLWDYIEAGKIMGAYVKNMSKTGKYYWVYAVVTPVDDGYISIRMKPTSQYFSVVKDLYKDLLEIENQYGQDWKKGMAESQKELLSKLKQLGFDSYDNFLEESLTLEFQSRNNITKTNRNKFSNSESAISTLFGQIMKLSKKRKMLLAKSDYLSNFSKELELVAINSTVRANFLGRKGAPLSIIGKEISLMSQTIRKELGVFASASEKLIGDINKASQALAIAHLNQESSDSYSMQIQTTQSSIERQIETQGSPFSEIVELLNMNTKDYSEQALSILTDLLNTMKKFESTIDSLCKVFQVLQFSYVAGCTEIARIAEESNFKPLFDNLRSISDLGKNELRELDSTLNLIEGSIRSTVTVYQSAT